MNDVTSYFVDYLNSDHVKCITLDKIVIFSFFFYKKNRAKSFKLKIIIKKLYY